MLFRIPSLPSRFEFFDTLIRQLSTKAVTKSNFDRNGILLVPGNHDLKRNSGKEFEKYDQFVEEFYEGGSSNRVHVIDKYNFICDFPEKKIAVLGFNSCRIEIEEIRDQDLEWINNLNFPNHSGDEVEIQAEIRNQLKQNSRWDDFGYIQHEEMDNLFTELNKCIPDNSEYNLVATFHHHFYPFPEIVNKKGDSSYIRNYTYVLEKFQLHKVRLVLHGHKHLAIQRAVTDNKYFEDPDSIIYVLAAGSIGCKDVYHPSFQWIRVFDRSSIRLVDGERYDFNDEELNHIKELSSPPQKKDEQSNSIHLIDSLQADAPKLYSEYTRITDDFEQLVQDCGISRVIEAISGLITIFPDIKIELRRNPELTYLILLTINYRVIHLKQVYQSPSSDQHGELIERLSHAITSVLNESESLLV